MLEELMNLHRYGVYATEDGLKGIRDKYVYVVLTDTGTLFSKISKVVTRQPYNHVSLSLELNGDMLYTYAIKTDNSDSGGIKVETTEELKGAKFIRYRLGVSNKAFNALKKKLDEMVSNPLGTSYNRLSILNFIFRMDIFNSSDESKAICSEFVANLLTDSKAEFIEGKKNYMLSPYDLVKNKRLEFVDRGTF